MRPENETTRRVAIGLALIFLFTSGSGEPMQATEKAKDVEARNKQIIRAGFDTWRNGTGGVFDLLAPNAKWTIVGNSPVSRTYMSRREFMDIVINPFNVRLCSRLVPTVRNIYADGDTVIALFDAEGTARAGKPYKNTYSWCMRMRGGAIGEVVAFFDTIEEDLKKFDVPTLIIHGDDDQIVPIGASAMLSSKLVKNATLKIYPGGSHSLGDTSKEQLNADLLAFLNA